nr:MAG TPA: hypothetical protein [Caudoviricetes sp.]
MTPSHSSERYSHCRLYKFSHAKKEVLWKIIKELII